jgi:hypothetical protein
MTPCRSPSVRAIESLRPTWRERLDGLALWPVRITDKHHITGKPTAVMRQLARVCPAGGIVLDPFAGSATTSVAALLERRRFVGIELNMVHHFPTDAGIVSIAIVPGNPEESELWWRMTQRNEIAMPPACTKVVDDAGVATIHDWIAQMP